MVKRLPGHRYAILILCCLLLTGCWDSLEIEKRTLAVSIAVDQDEEGYLVSLQVPNPRKIAGGGEAGGGGEGGPEAIEILQGRGKTVSEAIKEIQRKSNLPIFFGHTQTLLVGEDLARAGINPIIDFFRRNPQIRRQLWPIVVKGKAVDAIQTLVILEPIPTYYLRDLIELNTRSQRLPETTLGEVLVDLSTPWKQSPLFHYIYAKKDEFEWAGMAVFKQDKMVGVLNEQEVNSFVHLRYGIRGVNMIVPCGDGRKGEIAFLPKNIERKIVFHNKPSIDVHIHIKGDIEEISCNMVAKNMNDFKKLDQLIANEYEKYAKLVLQKAKNVINADIFHFEDVLHAHYHDLWKRLDLKKEFARIPIHVRYSVNIERIGLEAQ